ncbi:phage holin family protein [Gimesia sp.]|uniref:phage holin family protein n=1 Tax=Gimesia sp. TaxID=2024833 RepID=UPI0032ECD591
MAGEAMIRNSMNNQSPDIRGGFGDLIADLISLSELQIELLTIDSRDALRKSIYPLILLCLGLGLIVGAFPVMLFGMSWWLSEVTSLSLAGSCLIMALLSLAGAGLLFYLARNGLVHSLGYFKRTRDELRSNTQWIKKILSEKQCYHQTSTR